MIWADLHVHSTYSDGKMTLSELVDFYGQRGFGAIAVTDHICEEQGLLGFAARSLNYTLEQTQFASYMAEIQFEAERAWDLYQLLLIPGFEISKNSIINQRSAHLLGIGVSDWVSADGPVEEICKAIRAQGAVTVAAHPVSTGAWEPQTLHLWSRREELRDAFDAWEVASGPRLFQPVLESGLPMLANSDLHHAKQIQSWKTRFPIRKGHQTVDEILYCIRRQKLSFDFFRDPISLEGRALFGSEGHALIRASVGPDELQFSKFQLS